VFVRLFFQESLDTSVSMWWDSMCQDWYCGDQKRECDGDDERLKDAFLETPAKEHDKEAACAPWDKNDKRNMQEHCDCVRYPEPHARA
jgi:hypothetical protein